jgi:hypothetical protein
MSDIVDLDRATEVLSVSNQAYQNIASSIGWSHASLKSSRKEWDTAIVSSGVTSATVLPIVQEINDLSAQIEAKKKNVQILYEESTTAQNVANYYSGAVETLVETQSSCVGPEGAEGPQGEAYTGSVLITGDDGEDGTLYDETSSVILSSLCAISSVSCDTLETNKFTCSTFAGTILESTSILVHLDCDNTGIFTTSNVDAESIDCSSFELETMDVSGKAQFIGVTTASYLSGSILDSSQPDITLLGDLNALQVDGDFNHPSLNISSSLSSVGINTSISTSEPSSYTLEIEGSTNVSDSLLLPQMYVSQFCDATHFDGVALTTSQPHITSLGELTFANIENELTNTSDVNVSGVCTTIGGFSGVLLSSSSSQPEITSVGTLTDLSVSGLSSLDSVMSGGIITSTNGFSGVCRTSSQNSITSVGTLASVAVSGSLQCTNANVTGILTSSSGLVSTALSATQENITQLGTLTGLQISGSSSTQNTNVTNVSTCTYIDGTCLSSSHPSVTSIGTLTSLSASSMSAGSMSLSGGVLTASTLTGTLTGTPAQTSLTSLGTLSSLTISGALSVGVTSVSGVSTSSGGINATLNTPSQSSITSVGTQPSLNVTGVMTSGQMSVGNNVSAPSLSGTFINTSQAAVTSMGSLTSLSVSGTTSVADQMLQSTSSVRAFVSTTSSTLTNYIQLATNSGSKYFLIGVRGSTGSPTNSFFIRDTADRLIVNSSGYLGIGSTSPNVLLDMGSNSTALGSLTNCAAYIGLPVTTASNTYGGVLIGSGTSGTYPFIAASKSGSGTALALKLHDSVSISSSGAVTISGALSVDGVYFTSATYGSYGGLGFSQTHATVSRSWDTYYQNTASRPIWVSITIKGNDTSSYCQFSLYEKTSTGTVTEIDRGYTQSNSDVVQLSGVIPVGSYYKITNVGGTNTSASVYSWRVLS